MTEECSAISSNGEHICKLDNHHGDEYECSCGHRWADIYGPGATGCDCLRPGGCAACSDFYRRKS
jgi:hypothetical protein